MLYDCIQFSNSDRHLGEFTGNSIRLSILCMIQGWVFIEPYFSLALNVDSNQLFSGLNWAKLLLNNLEALESSDENSERFVLGEVAELL